MNNKVVIVGCGNVGMSYAYALLNQRTYVNKLYLIDVNEQRVEGEVMDLNHCLSYAPSKISINKGTYADCKDARLVVIAAGANQKPGETRTDLINKNASIFKEIVGNVMASGFDGIFLVATNPLDVMTYLTYKYSGLPASRVLGTGTSLDTARLQLIIGKKLCINPKNIHAYVIGEHGDTEFIPWSNASISLQNIKGFFSKEEMLQIEDDVRNAAYEIINRKGATYYGIGMAMVRITNAILGNENTIMALSIYDETNDVYVGMPAIVSENGVQRRVPLKLTEEETQKLQHSISVIKENINSLGN
ncbi:MAG: L-lactate dehydrogenase [Bacilli bacterium]|nr:L-lactate dehydrogenase [Bacilli bacterium]